MKESEIEKAVCDYAKKEHNCLVYKFTSPQRRSVPDRMFIYPGGLVLFIEFKAAGKRPTDAQWREIVRLMQQGANVTWTDSVEAGIEIIRRASDRYDRVKNAQFSGPNI